MQFKSIKAKILMSVIGICLSVSGVWASNVLTQIEISPSDNLSGYNISFGAQKPEEIKKIVSSDDKMIIQLKGINISSNYNTIYNNVSDIDNVTVETTSKNITKITFEGKNIAHSQIFFETTQGEALTSASGTKKLNSDNAIELSKPVSEYSPVYSKEMVEDMTSSNSHMDNLKLSVLSVVKNKQLRRYVKKGLKSASHHATKENLAYIFLGLGFVALAFKVMCNSNKQEPANIGLAQTLRQREIERAQEMDIAAKIEETKQRTQEPSFNPNSGYALKSYQASRKNPYTSQINSTIMQKRPAAKSTFSEKEIAPVKSQQIKNTKVSTPIKSKESINIDSAKFLESMAKIYEKNGRMDLARGLKAGIKKADLQKQTV